MAYIKEKKKMENQTIEKKEVVPEAAPVVYVPEVVQGDLISFDAYFHLLCARDNHVREHHKAPIQVFMKQFGDIQAQTLAWFDELFKKY